LRGSPPKPHDVANGLAAGHEVDSGEQTSASAVVSDVVSFAASDEVEVSATASGAPSPGAPSPLGETVAPHPMVTAPTITTVPLDALTRAFMNLRSLGDIDTSSGEEHEAYRPLRPRGVQCSRESAPHDPGDASGRWHVAAQWGRH